MSRVGPLSTLVALASLGACSATTAVCTPPADVVGTWSYAADQQALDAATISGALVITRQQCHDFDGSLDVVQVDAQGERRRLSGRVDGRVLDAGTMQFDAMLGATPRQHLATLSGDSMTGSWLELSGAAGASGGFRGKREDSP